MQWCRVSIARMAQLNQSVSAAAACIVAVMVGAILLVHLDNGFFMNWTGAGRGEGFEYHLLAIGLALPILAKGSGAYSIDGWLGRLLHEGRLRGR